MRTIAIIPARGGSKGIHRKNIKMLFGKPLIAHTIEQAMHSKLINKVLVSTEDTEIKIIAQEYLADVIDRPKELATDESSTESVIKHVLENTGNSPRVVLLQCTCPIRTNDDIDNAIKLMQYGNYDSVLSVTPSKSILWKEVGKYGYPITYTSGNRPIRRQDMNYYVENGSIYVFKRDIFMKEQCRMFGKKGLYIMPKERSVDIDTEEDFEYLEWRNKNENRK